METVLVVCLGNICRSPMAEGLLKRALPDRKIISAGITALAGFHADYFAQTVMQENGIDISSHVAKQINGEMVRDAGLVLVMDAEQKRYLEKNYPTARGKIINLGQFQNTNIADPYRQSLEVFRNTFQLLEQCVIAFCERLMAMN